MRPPPSLAYLAETASTPRFSRFRTCHRSMEASPRGWGWSPLDLSNSRSSSKDAIVRAEPSSRVTWGNRSWNQRGLRVRRAGAAAVTEGAGAGAGTAAVTVATGAGACACSGGPPALSSWTAACAGTSGGAAWKRSGASGAATTETAEDLPF